MSPLSVQASAGCRDGREQNCMVWTHLKRSETCCCKHKLTLSTTRGNTHTHTHYTYFVLTPILTILEKSGYGNMETNTFRISSSNLCQTLSACILTVYMSKMSGFSNFVWLWKPDDLSACQITSQTIAWLLKCMSTHLLTLTPSSKCKDNWGKEKLHEKREAESITYLWVTIKEVFWNAGFRFLFSYHVTDESKVI